MKCKFDTKYTLFTPVFIISYDKKWRRQLYALKLKMFCNKTEIFFLWTFLSIYANIVLGTSPNEKTVDGAPAPRRWIYITYRSKGGVSLCLQSETLWVWLRFVLRSLNLVTDLANTKKTQKNNRPQLQWTRLFLIANKGVTVLSWGGVPFL